MMNYEKPIIIDTCDTAMQRACNGSGNGTNGTDCNSGGRGTGQPS